MKSNIFKILFISVCISLLYSFFTVEAYVPYRSFQYVYKKGELNKASCPAPYLIKRVIKATDFEIPLSSPSDLFISDDGRIFLVDTNNSRILVLNENFVTENIISDLNKPEGIFVTKTGEIFIADTGNNRVLQLDANYSLIKMIAPKSNEILGENFIFYPRKVAVDSGGRIFVVARGQFNGIMQFTPKGEFSAFVGSNKVVASPLDILIKQFMTKEQRNKMLQFIPLEYSNLHIDDDDFIYAVTMATDETQKVKRLSPGGSDILVRDSYFTEITKSAKITAVCTDDSENFYYLDQNDGCIYAFNSDGSLLYAFGGQGDMEGNFKSPAAISWKNNNLYAVDSLNGSITVYEMTDYAKSIKEAGLLYNSGKYKESLATYQNVLKMNSEFTLGYVYIGRIYYRLEQYDTAMDFFKKGNFRGDAVVGGYGAAMEQYRNEMLRKNLSVVLTVILCVAVLIAALILFIKYRRRAGKRDASKQH